MIYVISCLNKHKKFERFRVPQEVFIYIRQLECALRNPKVSKLKQLYPDRFEELENDQQTQ